MTKQVQIDAILAEVSTVAVAGHIRPDGDCVGSCLAVANYIWANYPEKTCTVYLDHVPERFRFLPGASRVRHPGRKKQEYDLFIALDCADKERLADAVPYFDTAGHRVCMDHHISNTGFADQDYIFPAASSACEVVFESMDQTKLTKEVAECLYTGIVCDTGVFQYSCTSSRTMQIGGILMDYGINYPWLVDHVFFSKTFVQKQLLAKTLAKCRLHAGGRLISSSISRAEMQELGAIGADLDGIVSELRSTEGVEAAIFLHEEKDGAWKLSLRSASFVDVAKIAASYGGGGHARAAGATVKMDPEALLTELCAAMEEQLEER